MNGDQLDFMTFPETRAVYEHLREAESARQAAQRLPALRPEWADSKSAMADMGRWFRTLTREIFGSRQWHIDQRWADEFRAIHELRAKRWLTREEADFVFDCRWSTAPSNMLMDLLGVDRGERNAIRERMHNSIEEVQWYNETGERKRFTRPADDNQSWYGA